MLIPRYRQEKLRKRRWSHSPGVKCKLVSPRARTKGRKAWQAPFPWGAVWPLQGVFIGNEEPAPPVLWCSLTFYCKNSNVMTRTGLGCWQFHRVYKSLQGSAFLVFWLRQLGWQTGRRLSEHYWWGKWMCQAVCNREGTQEAARAGLVSEKQRKSGTHWGLRS